LCDFFGFNFCKVVYTSCCENEEAPYSTEYWKQGDYKAIKFHLDENELNYLVVTLENKKICVFKNGILIESVGVNSRMQNSDIPLVIGNWIGGDRPFNGMIEEVLISNSSISYDRVKSNWISIQNST